MKAESTSTRGKQVHGFHGGQRGKDATNIPNILALGSRLVKYRLGLLVNALSDYAVGEHVQDGVCL